MQCQYFSGQTYDEPRLRCDATQIERFRKAIGEAGVEALLKAIVYTAIAIRVVRSRLLAIVRAEFVKVAKRMGIVLKQTFVKDGRDLRRKVGGYAHSKQYNMIMSEIRFVGCNRNFAGQTMYEREACAAHGSSQSARKMP